MKKTAIMGVLLWMAASGVPAQTILVQEAFDGKKLDAAWSTYLNSPILVTGGKVNISNGDALVSAHRAFIARNTDLSGNATVGVAKVFNFFDHGLAVDLGLNNLSGVAGAGAARIAYFAGIACDPAAEKLTPATAENGVFFQIEKVVSGDYRLVMTERVGGTSTITYIGKLSNVPAGLSMTLTGTRWTLMLKDAAFADGANNRTSNACGELRAVNASGFKDFYLTIGVIHMGAAAVAGAMDVEHISVTTLPPVQTAEVQPAVFRPAGHTEQPAIMTANSPRAFFFRISESQAANPRISYNDWDATFDRLQGIMGKALDEELRGSEARNPEFFCRFKKEHPEQMVLLHFNGCSRDPRYETEEFFAGHWIYREAAMILSDVPAESGETEIKVSSTEEFKTGVGRFDDAGPDIGLFMIKDGKHDWQTGEQVQLVSVDHEKKTIRVKRGCYGTAPHAFPANKARAAAHECEGPWAKGNPMLWGYNFSTECPRDPQGRNCADALVDNLKKKFMPGGKLDAFDGVEFDATNDSSKGDMNGDGKMDDGIISGINTYGIGIVDFYRKLRVALGENRLIVADGVCKANQRGFGVLNGIESEGWPHHPDLTIKGWSGGLNRMLFWNREACPPVLNYVNHRFTNKAGKTNQEKFLPVLPFSTHRLVMAAAQFVDAAFCYSSFPIPEPGEQVGIWDELKKGTENKLNWLGASEGPAVHLAAQTLDILDGVRLHNPAIKDGKQVVTQELSCQGSNLFVTVRASGAPLKGYPESYARIMEVKVADENLAGLEPLAWQRFTVPMTWLNSKEFESTFYFRDITNSDISLKIEIEGEEPVSIKSVGAHTYPDVMYRVYEHGLVLANPSLQPYTFDLQTLTPDRTYRHLKASSKQDTKVNDGMPIDGKVTLGPLDGLFLVRIQ